MPPLNPKFCSACGSDFCTGRQAPSPGLGSREKATFRVWLMPSETLLPIPVKSAGRPISQMAAAAASTIQMVPSRVLVPRLRIRPCQASQTAPISTTTARYGK